MPVLYLFMLGRPYTYRICPVCRVCLGICVQTVVNAVCNCRAILYLSWHRNRANAYTTLHGTRAVADIANYATKQAASRLHSQTFFFTIAVHDIRYLHM